MKKDTLIARMRIVVREATTWAFKDQHKQTAIKLRDEALKSFTQHPEATGETYLQHLWFTIKMSVRFAYTSSVILLHGVFPFLCVRTASNQIEVVYRIMKSRIPAPRREAIDRELQFTPRYTLIRPEDVRIAIIGGGFSGALALANIVHQTSGSISIDWFEPDGSLGTGAAYKTQENVHLLNVRAERMGAFPEKAGDFYHWLQSEEGKAAAELLWPGKAITGESYVPRIVYAQYLRHIVKTTLQDAKAKSVNITIHHAEVTDASLAQDDSQKILLHSRQGDVLVDAAILATGNLPPKDFSFQAGLIDNHSSYVANVWKTPEDHIFPQRVGELSADAEVVIIGTGLTMVDTVLTLRTRGYKGTITAISRGGNLPAPHAHSKSYPAWDWTLAPQFAPRTTLGLLVRLREEVRRAKVQGYDWRAVIDSIRPVTQQLWKQLGMTEKRRFMKKLSTFWSIHRHRMAPDIYTELKTMQQSGALKIAAGKIYYVGSDKDGLTVAYRKRGTNRIETLRPQLVLNCTGPEYDIAASRHTLLKNLRDRELITVGPLRIGIETTLLGSAKGKAPDSLFPMGTLLVGEQFECTAVPELRQQAQEVATRVLARVQAMQENDSPYRHSAGEWI
jgi:uncharacterized NAD(P)/FAD-binding protein YdhS